MKKNLKVAVIQAKVPRSKEEGEQQVTRLVKEALKGRVDMIGLPEDCVAPYSDVQAGYDALSFLSKVARDNEIYLFGATAVKGSDGLNNVGFLFDRSGNLVARHNKVVLTPPEVTSGLAAGNTLRVFDTEFGKMAILICKDAFHRYAAWFFDKLRKAGVEIILIPSLSINVSRSSYDIDLWVESLKTLAKWFYVCILTPGTIGSTGGEFKSFGHALIIGPGSNPFIEGSEDKEQILKATLNLTRLSKLREIYESKWQPKDIPEVEVITQKGDSKA